MKKITFYLMMLLGITAFSQVEIVENFDSTPNNQVPAGWSYTNNFRASTNFVCGGSGSAAIVGLPAGNSGTLTTPNYTTVTNATDLTVSFSVNVFEQVSQFPPPSFVAPASGWGSLVLEYSIDGGTNWITAATVNDSNFTYTSTSACVDIAPINVGSLAAGTDFQARFVATSVNVANFALWVVLDNVSITQVATTVPNCDATLISPANGSTDADIDATLVWQAATGIPTGYTVSVGTTTGGTDIVNMAATSETNFSLDGLGLAYETEYFVNIVPYNGFGDAVGCTEESFTTRVAPIDGATCGSPHVVGAFPYIVPSDDTANYENNVNTGSCGTSDTSYMLGNDVFYEITPVTDVSINIDLASISNNGAGMHLMKGCPTDVDKECLDFVGTFSTTGGSLNISEAVLLAGNTYYLVLSNSSSSRTYSYSLIITQNSCINPEFTMTPVADCGNGQFTVDVDVTYMGDASTVSIADDFGNSNNNIPSTGVVNMGPYPSGSTVNFTLTNDQDGTCSFSDSTYYYCPPSNDECANAIALGVNTDDTCTLFTSASNAGATESAETSSCSGNTNDVWFSFVADGETMILEYLNVVAEIGGGGIIQNTELYEGTCGSLTNLACSTGQYVQLSNLIDGNTYYLRNKTNLAGEYAQNFDICLRTAPTPPVNDECSSATVLTLSTDDQCDNVISGTTVGATTSVENSCDGTGTPYNDVWYAFTPAETGFYEFTYTTTSTATTTTRYFIYEGTCGSFLDVSTTCSTNNNQVVNLVGGQSYFVMVRTLSTGPGVDFDLCVWKRLEDANTNCSTPATLTESPDSSGANSVTANFDNVFYSPEGCASSSSESQWYSFTPSYTGTYHFDFTRVSGFASYTVYNTDDCAQTETAGYVTGISSCSNSVDRSVDLVAGNTYLVFVYSSSAAEFTLFAYPDPSLGVDSAEFESFKYYPNPTSGDLTLEAGKLISQVSVYNMVGQEVMASRPNDLNTSINMSNLKNGVYFVTVEINNSRKTIKVVKQ